MDFFLLNSSKTASLLFAFDVDDCDHLDPHPVYSETQHHNINLTTWNKPWRPEIDWLNSYVNLFSLSDDVLQGLFNGYSVTKRSNYLFDPAIGCLMLFKFDIELLKTNYFEHYANTNKTMVVCTPIVPMRPDVYRLWTERDQNLGSCINYNVLENALGSGNLKYIWNSERLGLSLAFSVAMLITLIGFIGKSPPQDILKPIFEFFTNLTKLAIMPILASEALLREKKSSDKILPPMGIEPVLLITSYSKSNTIFSTLT